MVNVKTRIMFKKSVEEAGQQSPGPLEAWEDYGVYISYFKYLYRSKI